MRSREGAHRARRGSHPASASALTTPPSRSTARVHRRRRFRGRALGLMLVMAGAGLLLHVGWDLWGTGLATARAQTKLRADLHQAFTHPRAHRMPVVPGGADGLIRIPAVHLDMAFVEGIGQDALAKGPGHYPNTPMPGSGGNVAIAGHRTTHLAPFWAIDALHAGDDVTLITRDGRFVYRVMWVGVAAPDADWVLAQTGVPSLTLTTCWPRFSASHRLVVRAIQVYGRSPLGLIDHLNQGLGEWMQPPASRMAPRVA